MKRYSDIKGDGGSRIVDQVTGMHARLKKNLERVRYKVAVMSGKGGVGKSTVTVALAANIASMGFKVGILDADLNGPSIPKMVGVSDAPAGLNDGVEPPEGALGIRVMSMELLLSSSQSPVKWDGPSSTHPWISAMEATALRELISDTRWGELDLLLIDMPPVLSRLNDLAGLMPDLSGAVIVTVPSEVSFLTVMKSINRVKELNIPILGLVENMRGFTCVNCGHENSLFKEEEMEEALGYIDVPYLGRVPFDAGLTRLTDIGLKNHLKEEDTLPLAEVFKDISEKVLRQLGEEPATIKEDGYEDTLR